MSQQPGKQTNLSAREVESIHRNSDVNGRKEALHHTLGSDTTQASPGDHNHNGGTSVKLLAGVTLSGARGGNVALLSVIQALTKLGATDNTTA